MQLTQQKIYEKRLLDQENKYLKEIIPDKISAEQKAHMLEVKHMMEEQEKMIKQIQQDVCMKTARRASIHNQMNKRVTQERILLEIEKATMEKTKEISTLREKIEKYLYLNDSLKHDNDMQRDVLKHQKEMIDNMANMHKEALIKISSLEKKVTIMREYIQNI